MRPDQAEGTLLQRFNTSALPLKILIAALVVALIAGIFTGFKLAPSNSKNSIALSKEEKITTVAQKDTKTFRDFAEGKIQKKPTPTGDDAYTEGTHLLIRENAVPVALTSSVVDLSQYEGKKVKVYGETQKAVKEGWLMDVGKVEEIN